ncbi:arylsulfatase [Xylariomycetidae sp. FL2044]|nr:arylsulfatase [Xylariomycetidae sp. FL2044]
MAKTDKRPNFLIIVADDLGFSDVGAFGSEIQTPNIDSIAKDGLRFTDFHAASACSPTRSMLMTGTDHHIAGLGTMYEGLEPYYDGVEGYEGYLNDKVVTVSELLRDGGYHTLLSGKWHLGLERDRWPCKRGFDRSYSLLPGCANHFGWEPQLMKQGEEIPPFLEKGKIFYVEDDKSIAPKDLGPDFYSSDAFADRLVEYLKDWKANASTSEKPFFAYLPFSAPHWPLQAPKKDIEPYIGRYDEGPAVLREQRLAKLKEMGLVPDHAIPHDVVAVGGQMLSKDWETLSADEKRFSARTMEAYAGMVHNMDKGIGRVLDHLRSTGEYNQTVIMFMSDNGAEGLLLEAVPIIEGDVFDHIATYYDNSLDNIGEGNSYVWYGPHWACAATAPSRLYKAFTTEGGIRVPLIMRYPPLTRGGKDIDHVFGTVMDAVPTILDLAGVPHPGTSYGGRAIAAMRGKSWLPHLRDPDKSPRVHDEDTVSGWELFGRQAVRKHDWKAVFIPKPYGPEKWELFNLKEDPGERVDLAEQGQENKDRLAGLLQDWERYKEEVGVIQGKAQRYVILDE